MYLCINIIYTRKKVYNRRVNRINQLKNCKQNVNLRKYQGQIQHPVIDLKMELLVKIVNDFNL